jgi:predicted dehydrogenase
MVRVAISGLGFMGKTHLAAYLKLPDVQVVALCDSRKENLGIRNLETGGNIRTASRPIDLTGVKKYVDYGTMLSEGGFDFVDLCLPTFLHADLTVDSLNAGYHVFCEKPMALNGGETRRMLDAAHKTGKLLGIGQCLRFWPAYVETKRLIDSRKYGKVRYAEFSRLSSPVGWSQGNWMRKGSLSGNAALDLHIHDVDMILYLFGKPGSVRSNGVVEGDGSVSHITTMYTYEDVVVQSTGGWICSDTFGFNMRAFFILEYATVELDFSKTPVVNVFPHGAEKYALAFPEGDGYFHELKDFIEGIERGQLSGVVTGKSAADSVELCLIEISSVLERQEKTVDIP